MHQSAVAFVSVNRGHETAEHRRFKWLIGALLCALGFIVFYEKGLCDAVACRLRANGEMRLLGIEVERSTRHLRRNVTKCFSGGCDAVLIVVPGEKLLAAIRRKLLRELPRSTWTRISISTIARLEKHLAQQQRKA